MKQFMLPGSYTGGPTTVTLGEAEARRLLRVLRLREGDSVPAVDPRGGRYTMTILRAGPRRCDVTVRPEPGTGPTEEPTHPRTRVTLLQCLPKGRKIDLIVRQATEAGVARIIPLVSERTVVRVNDEDGRLRRLIRIAREAVQQSGAARMPVIEEPRELASVAGSREDWGAALLFHERPDAAVPLHRLLADRPRVVSILIGPEGGVSDAEVALLGRAGFRIVHVGTSVLRVETAATYALGAVMTILQERDEWKPHRA
jgi:16S rRNA (uracil1498-N3)-methyltransferase